MHDSVVILSLSIEILSFLDLMIIKDIFFQNHFFHFISFFGPKHSYIVKKYFIPKTFPSLWVVVGVFSKEIF